MMRSIFRTVALAAMMSVAGSESGIGGSIEGGSLPEAPGSHFAQAQSVPAQAPSGETGSATDAAPKGEMKGEAKNEAKSETKSCGAAHAFQKRDVAADQLRTSAEFALNVLAQLSPNARNATISPFGLTSVLSTLDLGANDAMRKAIAATLRLKVEDLRSQSRLLALASQRDASRFASFNAIFVDHRLPLMPGIADRAKADGDVDVRPVDFGSQADIDGINKLLATRTNDRIKSILEPGSGATLVAANAFVFKDCWKTPFDKSNTADKPFTRPDNTKVDRPTMSVTSDAIGYRESGRFVAVELPYVDEDFALTLVTTQPAKQGAVTQGLAKPADFKEAAPLLSGIDLAEANVTLSLPKFGGAVDNELLDALSKMGLQAGLGSADQLPGFSKGLTLSRVRQKTWLSVDETGTEAAAVTAAEATRSAEAPKTVSVSFDKPFVFALRHRPTGAILMAGYVADPAEEDVAKKDDKKDDKKGAKPGDNKPADKQGEKPGVKQGDKKTDKSGGKKVGKKV